MRGARRQRILADLVSLIRFALGQDDELVPHSDVVRLRFDLWLTEQSGAAASSRRAAALAAR